jgi:predicted nuclease with RNAse H fold
LTSPAASASFSPLVLGLDLAGAPGRPTGACLLRGRRALTSVLHSDTEILDLCRAERPALAAVDAPLHLPPGRRSIGDRNGKHLRECDEELLRRRIPFFPITLGPMRVLTVRGMRLKTRMEKMGLRVVEIYPGGAQDVWGIPRAKRDRAGLLRGLRRLGLLGLKADATNDELDAASGALAGQLFLRGQAEVLGDFKKGAIILPRP